MPVVEAIAAFRQLLESCSQPKWTEADNIQLTVTGPPVSLTLLRNVQDADLFPSIEKEALQRAFDEGREDQVPGGEIINVRVPRTVNRLAVARDLKDLLSIPDAVVSEPGAYVFWDVNARNGVFSHIRGEDLDGASAEVHHYHEALRFWEILQNRAEHTDISNGALLFFGIRRTQITPGFGLEDITAAIAIQEIEDFVDNVDRQETRREIFASVLSEFLRDQNPANAFPRLLRESETFARRLKEGMAIYLAEHSPEKLAEEARVAGFELSEKLENLIASLEVKSLSIPVAILLAVKEVDQGAGITALNAVIAASALGYGLTMTFVHESQKTLLELLKTTILSTKKELKDKGLDEANPILREAFGSLEKRRANASRGSWTMCIFSWAPLVCVLCAMWLGTPKNPFPIAAEKQKQVSPSPQPLAATPTASSAATPTASPSQPFGRTPIPAKALSSPAATSPPSSPISVTVTPTP
jgi:hypothetical protein